MSRRTLATVAVNVAVFCVLAELVSLGYYYVEHGTLFYTSRVSHERIQETEQGRLTGDALHPYFGPTHQPRYPFDIPESLSQPGTASPDRRFTNNFGFVSPYDYPYLKKAGNEYLVGIFGGSVGVWFCQLGAPRLVARLQSAAAFAGKHIVPLCFSHEGYKQPQQVLVLAYFLSIGQPLDLVINIDGFNEVALGALNHQHGRDVSMPSVQHLDPLINLVDQSTLTPEKLRLLAAINEYKERLNRLAARIDATRIAAVDFVLERYYEKTSADYNRALGAFSNLPSNPADKSVIRVTPEVSSRDGSRLYDDIAQNWAAASLLMNQMLAPRGVRYFHFLQPNQYYTVRRFGTDEATIALNKDSPFKTNVEQGYPALIRRADALREQEAFFDATHAFDTEPASVYTDDCCHYTLRGNHRLADVMAEAILSARVPGHGTIESPP
jgi:hypothetical protein